MSICLRRREFIAGLGAAAWPLATRAQQQAMPVVGLLDPTAPEASAFLAPAFRNGLNETGYVEGRNVAIEYRWAHNEVDRLPELAADLVHRRVAVIVTSGIASALAAKAATTTIPIVFSTGADPIQDGLVASLNRPGGNVTGVTSIGVELTPKRLGLLHELLPRAARFAVLVNPNDPNAASMITNVRAAASTVGRQIEVFFASTNREVETAFASLAQKQTDALLVLPSTLFGNRRVQLATLAVHHKVPVISVERGFVEAGGLMSYGASYTDRDRQVGVYTGRVLKGDKPADLPVMQSTRFEFVINLQTARLLGLDIPPGLLAIADEVIE
jgi:putative ABC transport system substrate-binding protein